MNNVFKNEIIKI